MSDHHSVEAAPLFAPPEPEPDLAPRREGASARLHMGLAEQGKLFALEGDHPRALYYYRKAMQLAVAAGDPEIFFRHYLECVVESLERTGAYAEVIDYCERAIALYGERPPEDAVSLRDLAHIHQRLGVVRLKQGKLDEARAALREAASVLRGSGQRLPLGEALLRWLDLGFHIDEKRITAEQVKHGYFAVRRDRVDPALALQIPDEVERRERVR